ncbi:unnamed protein product, partial [Laminaria digitata]
RQRQQPRLQPPPPQAGAQSRLGPARKGWNHEGWAVLFILRGGHHATSTLTAANLSNLLRKIAHPAPEMLNMALTFVDVDLAAFGPPIPEGRVPVPRDTSAHLATFLEVFKVVVSHGTETSSEASRAIRRKLLGGMRATLMKMRDFMDRHAAQLDPSKAGVEKLLMRAVNTDIKDFIGELFSDAEFLRQTSSFAAPANGTGQPVRVPRFPLLSRLVEETHRSNLIERMGLGLKPPSPYPQQAT